MGANKELGQGERGGTTPLPDAKGGERTTQLYFNLFIFFVKTL